MLENRKTASEFYDSCLTSEKQELARLLAEDGLFSTNNAERFNLNINDEIFLDSLNVLKTKRHLLTLEEENFVNSLAQKFKY